MFLILWEGAACVCWAGEDRAREGEGVPQLARRRESEAANSRRSGCSFEAEDSPPGQVELHVSPAGLMRVVALGAGGARPGRELPPQRF